MPHKRAKRSVREQLKSSRYVHTTIYTICYRVLGTGSQTKHRRRPTPTSTTKESQNQYPESSTQLKSALNGKQMLPNGNVKTTLPRVPVKNKRQGSRSSLVNPSQNSTGTHPIIHYIIHFDQAQTSGRWHAPSAQLSHPIFRPYKSKNTQKTTYSSNPTPCTRAQTQHPVRVHETHDLSTTQVERYRSSPASD